MAARRFSPPWSVEEQDACFVAREAAQSVQINGIDCRTV